MLRSSLLALLALASMSLAADSTFVCRGSQVYGRSTGLAVRDVAAPGPSNCFVRCNPNAPNARVLISEDDASYGGNHVTCRYDTSAGGNSVGCVYHNHDYDNPGYADTFAINENGGTQADCPATLQKACGGGAYARRSTRKPLDALLKREKMAVVPQELAERKKVWGRGKRA